MVDNLPEDEAPTTESLSIIRHAEPVETAVTEPSGASLVRVVYEDRKALVSRFFGAGVAITAAVNAIAIGYFFYSLRHFASIDSEYQLYAFLIRGAAVGLFELCGTYSGVKLIKAAERLTLPTGTDASQIRALTGEKEGKADVPDLLELLRHIALPKGD